MSKYYKLLLFALGLSLTLNASASHVNFLTLPDYKDIESSTGISITSVVGQASTNLNFLIRNNTNSPLKFLGYSTNGALTTSMLQYVEPALEEIETGHCFIPGTRSPNTAVAPHNTCTASFTIDTSHITKPGTYKTWLVVQDEWDVKSKPLLINLHMHDAGGAAGGSLAVLPDTSEAYSSPAVKRILVHNLKATAIPKLNITEMDPDNAFIFYDGKNGNEDSHKGPWCTTTNCPNYCVANDGLPAHATCYVYVKAKNNVAIGVPAFATLKIGDGTAATDFTLQLTNQSLLYVAGNFTNEWDELYVAAYDGSEWHDIGSGVAVLPFNGLIGVLATDVKGNLYAGGNFNLGAIGLPYHYVMRYDDFAWSGIGIGPTQTPFNHSIFTLLFGSQGNLYVGGNFIDEAEHRYVAKYAPATKHWLNFGNGPENIPFNGAINALLADPDGNIYAAGDFANPTSSDANYIAKKSGTRIGDKWNNIDGGGSNRSIESIVMDGEKNLYADIERVESEHNEQRYIGEYNATAGQWHNIGPTTTSAPFEFDDNIYTLAIGVDDNLYVAGDFTDDEGDVFVAKYDTKARVWSDIGSGPAHEPFNDSIRILVADNNGNLYAAGDFTDDDEWDDRYIAKYNAEGWKDIGVGPDDSPFNGIIVSMAIGHRLFINEV